MALLVQRHHPFSPTEVCNLHILNQIKLIYVEVTLHSTITS
jgi:hypothetical protein